MLAATVDAEEAETTFLFSLLVFLRLLWCVPRRMAAFFFMALLLCFLRRVYDSLWPICTHELCLVIGHVLGHYLAEFDLSAK